MIAASQVAVPRTSTTVAPYVTALEAIDQIRRGRMVVVSGAGKDQNEGGLIIAAEFASPDVVNFMATHARGLICVSLTDERCRHLRLGPMTAQSEAPAVTPFRVSVEARDGVTTGISAYDRARTIAVAIDPAKSADDLVRPGHVFPLRAEPGGVLARPGRAEVAIDLACMAGLTPAGVVCEILNQSGAVAGADELAAYGLDHGLSIISIADIVEHRLRSETLIERRGVERLATRHGVFRAVTYLEKLTGRSHLALVRGAVDGAENVVVWMHTGCKAGEVFGSRRCDCGERLDWGLGRIAAADRGVLVYCAQSERCASGDHDYRISAQILEQLELRSISMLGGTEAGRGEVEERGIVVRDHVVLPGTGDWTCV